MMVRAVKSGYGILTRSLIWLLLGSLLLILSAPVCAQKIKEPKHGLDLITFAKPELRVVETDFDSDTIRTQLLNAKEIDQFRAENGPEWKIFLDARRGRPTLIDGGAIPFIPGNMNSLSWFELPDESKDNESIPVDYVEKIARDFMWRYKDILLVNPDELVLDPLGSGPVGNSIYFLRFQWYVGGVPVEGASVFFRINNGNLIQVATTNIGDISLDTKPAITPETAWQLLNGYLGSYYDPNDIVEDPGSLVIIPVTPDGQNPDTYQDSDFNEKISYKLAYRIIFTRPEVVGYWEGMVDAHTGELLRFVDAMRYGSIHGGIRPSDGLPAEEDHPFPFANTGLASPNNYTDAAGNFTGNSATTTLTGKYAHIIDSCGSISGTTTTGEIDFLSGPTGTDCSVPTGNTCGAGNTKPSRTLYWNCTNINMRAQVWNPTNTWLTSNYVNLHVNGSASCNAGSSGLDIYFYKKASGCNNLGEIPGVAMHEWAHSYDTNDGSGQQDKPLETYADWTAIMSTHVSCTGSGFLTSGKCSGYGNACKTCTGVRDCDRAAHNNTTAWTSANKGSVWGTSYCSAGSYNGPCGWEDHCESGLSTQALWDFVVTDLITECSMDINSAWMLEDRLWFTGVKTLDNFYTCSSSVTNGCGGTNLYTVMRAVDDDGDGTANGTPHAHAIYHALNRHLIDCNTYNDSSTQNQNQTSCPTLTVTTMSGVAGSGQCVLNWSAVTNATRYFIYRNEGTCSAGFTKIATVSAPTVTYTDTMVSAGITYNYRFVAATASDSCNSAISNCVTLTPTSGGCTAPGAPTLSSATGVCAGVNLVWTAGSGTTLSYNVYRYTGACGGAYTKLAGMPVTGTTYSDTTAVAGTSYAYVIRGCCDAAGTTESVNSNCLTATRLAIPSAPGSVTATGACNYNTITWGTVTGATSYNVLRGTACGTTLNTFTGVTSPYNDTTAVAGTTYNYWVVAINSCGTSSNSSCATATRLATPAAPGAPTFTNVSCNTLTVNWTAVSGATSYDVYRKTGANCSGASAVATGVTGTSYGDSGLSASTQYGYNVVATNSCGSSANGTCATVTTTGTPAAPTGLSANGSCTAVDLSWTASSGATSYNVLRTESSNCSTGLSTIGTSATTTYSDTTAVAGTTYYYVVQAVNTCGTSANSTCANAARLAVPAAPTGVTATPSCTGNTITWSGTATSFNVLRGTTCGSVLNTFTGVTSPYNDTTAVAGTTYNYWVVGINSCGTSANSSCATAARLVSPTPTISGLSTNTCPATTVTLSTENGMSGYQWYLGGTPIGGATSYQYTATASGSYTVSYTAVNGCSGTSAAHAVTIVACAPNIVYSTHGTLTQVTGNGDSYYDFGEKWSVEVTLTNSGNIPANNVTAVFAGNDIEVCSPTGSFGTIAVGGTSSVTFQFVISTAATCGGSIGFDVTTKTSTELTPAGADETDVFSITVGSGSGAGTVTLFGPDDTPATSGLWAGSISSQTATHCSHTTAYNRVGNNNNTYLASDISTVGYTNIHVIFDAGVTATGQTITLEYSTNSGGSYTTAGWSYTGSTTWQCSQDVTLPSSCENISTLRVRFRTNNIGTTSRGMMDNISITGDAPGYDCSYVGSGTCVECVTPGTPVIDSVTDVSACAQSGVQVNYTANTPYTTHDLYVDGSLVVSDYASGATYNPGNTSSHSYVVRAINGLDTCNTDSSSTPGTDANNTPGAPNVTAVTDVSACAQSGVTVTYTAGSGATSHNLYDNGSLAVTGYTSGATYTPGDTASHTYIVRAINGTCWTESNSMAGTDANNSTTPTVTGAAVNTCPDTTVTLSTESGMSSYQWYIGGSPIGGANAYQYIAAASGTYTVSYTNGSGCSGTSAGHAVTINSCDVVPGEVAVGADFTWTGQVISWTGDGNATGGYRVYRGLLSNLPALCDGTTDFCLRNQATATSLDVSGDDPSGQSGRCFYYLITGYSEAGEGPAGTATCGTRQVNSSGGCS